MLRAFAVKGVALAAALAAGLALPGGWAVLVISVISLATIGFLTYAIVHPRSQFFVPVIDRLGSRDPIVALTFDDGPDPVFTPRILDVLAAHQAHATFFVLGERAARYPEIVQRIHREGHSVGTHTQHHTLRFHFGSRAYVTREIEDAIAVVAKLLPAPPTLFRPPQGLRTPPFAAGWRRLRGLTCVTWSVRGLDSLRTTADKIVARVAPKLVPGAIVTLHDGTGLGGGADREPTLAALETLLGECKTRGLRCVALDGVGGAVP
ncbi:MAG: polysaccharide deacetylase family protein [Myxococcales bacterium]|nr:polysaccharide deacetylase family protein [Myxococcales bacterium]